MKVEDALANARSLLLSSPAKTIKIEAIEFQPERRQDGQLKLYAARRPTLQQPHQPARSQRAQ
jgi:hypothetical protein